MNYVEVRGTLFNMDVQYITSEAQVSRYPEASFRNTQVLSQI